MKGMVTDMARTASGKKIVNVPLKKAIKRDWQLYLMLSLPLFLVILFKYAAYPGLLVAFQNYKVMKGIMGSKWVGLENFRQLFAGVYKNDFLKALKNSICFNLLDLFVGFPVPIILALMLNELRLMKFKKVSQTILYLPHFLSWAIIGSVAYTLFRPSTGLVNIIMGTQIPFLNEKWHWAVSYLLIGIWQGMGWGTILYLAAITSINGELYEAAMIDGAGRWRRMWHITLPGIKGTIVTLLIMSLGRVMGSSLERLQAFGNTDVYDFQYQLAIFVYEYGIKQLKYSVSTAVDMFQSLVGLFLVLISDRIAKKLGEDGLL